MKLPPQLKLLGFPKRRTLHLDVDTNCVGTASKTRVGVPRWSAQTHKLRETVSTEYRGGGFQEVRRFVDDGAHVGCYAHLRDALRAIMVWHGREDLAKQIK